MASKALAINHPNPWRNDFEPANFGGAFFYCEVGKYESGHRLVIHEFPKKDEPYTESMGRRYYAFTVRGYCIQSATQRDYRAGTFGRDRLMKRLEAGGGGMLTLPFLPPKHVMCRSWSVTEEDRRGGYCVFDMQFVEGSALPFKPTPDPRYLALLRVNELRDRTLVKLSGRP